MSLTRSPEVAAYWASVRRVLTTKGAALFSYSTGVHWTRAYKIDAVPGPYWHANTGSFTTRRRKQIGHDVTDLARHLVGFVVEVGTAETS